MTDDELRALYGSEDVRSKQLPVVAPYSPHREHQELVTHLDKQSLRWNIVPALQDQIQTVANSPGAYTDDLELYLDILDVGCYVIRTEVLFNRTSGSAGLTSARCQFTGTTSNVTARACTIATGAAAGTDNESIAIGTSLLVGPASLGSAVGIGRYECEAILNVTVPGRFKQQWSVGSGAFTGSITRLIGSSLKWFKAVPVSC